MAIARQRKEKKREVCMHVLGYSIQIQGTGTMDKCEKKERKKERKIETSKEKKDTHTIALVHVFNGWMIIMGGWVCSIVGVQQASKQAQ